MGKFAGLSLKVIMQSTTARAITFHCNETQDGFSAGPGGFSSLELFSGLHHDGSMSPKKSTIYVCVCMCTVD